MKTEGSFKNKDAQDIYYRAHLPDKPRAAIVLVHGLGEHSLKYDYFAEQAYGKNFAFFAYDQRGHGRSGGVRCHVDDFSDLTEDLRQMVEIAKIGSLREDVFIVGLSLGGLVCLRFSEIYGGMIKGAALSAPALRFAKPPSGIVNGTADILSILCPRLSTPNRVPQEYLSHDTEMVKQTKEDRYSQRIITFRMFTEFKKAIKEAFADAGKMTVPALILQGTEDKVIDPSGAKDFFGKIASADKELKLYDGLYHELLREKNRQEVMGYILDWIMKRTGG